MYFTCNIYRDKWFHIGKEVLSLDYFIHEFGHGSPLIVYCPLISLRNKENIEISLSPCSQQSPGQTPGLQVVTRRTCAETSTDWPNGLSSFLESRYRLIQRQTYPLFYRLIGCSHLDCCLDVARLSGLYVPVTSRAMPAGASQAGKVKE